MATYGKRSGGGGGSGTVVVGASLAGDGSSGDPLVVAAGGVDSTMLAANAVVRAAIGDDAVGADEIDQTADAELASLKVGTGSVTACGVRVGAANSGLCAGTFGGIAIAEGGTRLLDLVGSNGGPIVLGTLYIGFGGGTLLQVLGTDLVVKGAKDVQVGADNALATTATAGFLNVPSCAGTPTGTPTPRSGKVPLVVDTTNNKLYGYYGGAWHDLTGA